MRIQNIKLVNYKLFRDCVIEFNGDHCVFAGVNGSGKSSVLDALVLSLSWFLSNIQGYEKKQPFISYNHITKGKDFCEIEINVEYQNVPFSWNINAKQITKTGPIISGAKESGNLFKHIRTIRSHALSRNNIVIAYYSVNRSATGEIPIVPDSSIGSGWELYENALEAKTGFNSFFDWFRLQDDLMRDKRLSQEDWMRRNLNEISKKYKRIIDLANVLFQRNHHFKESNMLQPHFMHDNAEVFWNNPHRYFYYLVDLAYELSGVLRINFNLVDFILELEHAIFRLADYQDRRQDDEHRDKNFLNLISIIGKYTELFSLNDFDYHTNLLLWSIIDFSTTIGLWWMSDMGKKEIESVLNRLRDIPLVGNSRYLENNVFPEMLQVLRDEENRINERKIDDRREVWTITDAINSFMPEYTNFRINRTPNPQFVVDKNGETFPFDYLSDGERCLIAMIGDIARRLTIANPDEEYPLKGEGVILIDELELHLHPKWQRVLLEKFHEVFPNCQLIASTHSPQIISNVAQNNLYVLKDGEVIRSDHSFGRTSNRILEDIMDTDARPKLIKDKLEELFRLIERGDLRTSLTLYKDLMTQIGDDPELVRADVLIRRLKRKKGL